MSDILVRTAHAGDADTIVVLWHKGWHDAHAVLVPPAALALRTPASFAAHLPALLAQALVAERRGLIVGSAAVKGAELNQFYIAEAERGAGLAA